MADKTERVSANVTPEVKEAIEEQLDYGDHISDWLREAIEEKLERDASDESGERNPATAVPS